MDSCGTKDGKKLTFLNYSVVSIKINERAIYLNRYKNPSDFVEYSIDLSDFNVIAKINEELNQPDLPSLMKKNRIIENFYEELTQLFENQTN